MGTNSALIGRWFEEVWNQGREDTIDELCSKEAIGYGQGQQGAFIHGPEHFKQFWRSFRSAFTDIHVDINDTFEQHDKAVARWIMSMRHAGEFLGISPSGKHVSVSGISVQRFAGGKIIEAWDNWDQLDLLVQLGAVPKPKFL